ncbi:MAG: putative hydro-lyase [Chloroflexi bacterium]|nr:putative hydro-lyase [Chloroflexota bacterium]
MATTSPDLAAMAGLTGAEARARIRAGQWRRPTAGVAVGYAQANVVILPAALAEPFHEFCAGNPQACPLLEVTAPGSPEPRRVAPGADLRRDVPRYRVYHHGTVMAEVDHLLDLWRPDLVAFLLGCSFTTEAALLRAGVRLRHLEQGTAVPMYRTNRACAPAGPFHGPLVVSMRPLPPAQVELARAVTARYPRAHGAPVHVGDPAALGIADLSCPDYGAPVPMAPGEVPVFWACGVTPQAAAEAARLEFMITHAPGHMFITDLRDEELADG